jgi:glycosyltransferase involved in cell wall biosynthesis
VFVTQAADPADPVLGATIPKIRELAARVDELVVLADRVDAAALPENCRAKSFSAPSRAVRGARYVAAVSPELSRRPIALVAHMAPVYAVLAAPLAQLFRVPLLLWFTQQGGGRMLTAAERVVEAVLTVDERSVPIASPKVRAIGHGIDVDRFPCIPAKQPPLRRLLGLGRYARVKDWQTAVRAVAELSDASLVVYGPVLGEADGTERRAIGELATELGISDRVALGGDVPYACVPSLLQEADALVNPTLGNAADKAVYEAAASCLPVFAASPVFAGLLPDAQRFPAGDPGALAARIRTYQAVDCAALRERVRAEHSVGRWAERVLELCR